MSTLALTTSPYRADFSPMGMVYMDAAYTHPLSVGARRALDRYLNYRAQGPGADPYAITDVWDTVQRQYAKLIGADANEVSFVPSTMAGENFLLTALGLKEGKGRIITDSLHFTGSLYLYDQLARRGARVDILPARDGVIDMADLAEALAEPADLVALSLVSNYNGFRHDLDLVCQLAHAQGTPVYADIIQAAGAVPFDVRTSGVDFCSGASYKWLMGDFGLGFLYVRRDRQAALDPQLFGYRQLSQMSAHPEEARPVRWSRRDDATGLFTLGTAATGVAAQLEYSLAYIEQIGVDNIAASRQRLLKRLRSGLLDRGARLLSPDNSGTPILVFDTDDVAEAARKLERRKIFVTAYDNRIRVSPSVYNDDDDVDQLLQALSDP